MHTLSRRFFIVFFYTIISVFCVELFSQTDYIMRVANSVKVNSNTIEFDVYIKSTGPNFILTAYQCTFSFTQAILNNGNISFSYIPGTSQFLSLPPEVSIGILNNGAYILTFASITPGQETITSTQKRVGRFRLSNTNPFIGDGFNILWCFTEPVTTILTGSGFTNITNRNNHIHLSGTATFPLTVSIENDWNLISIPGFHPVDQKIDTWWVNRDPNTSVFNSSYQAVTTLEPGNGYWMKHSGAQVYNIGEEWPSEGMFYSPNYPIIARSGWNLIGVYNYNLSVAEITTTPAGLQNEFVYGFTPNNGYTATNILTPGNGYLIYLTSAGLINLPDSGYSGVPNKADYTKEDWGKIVITDNADKSYTLYAIKGNINLEAYQLPPVPPSGIFDVRYGSGRFAEDLSSGIQSIEMSGIEYPVKVKVENMSIKLQDETGKEVSSRLNPGEEITIGSSLINKLLVSDNLIPDQYSLEQNYPNPFNAGTTIGFSVPEDVNNVKLTIYDALGQKIIELVNSKLEVGKYSYYWDASNAASGLYIYELRTEKFVSMKKLMLLK